MSTHSLNSHTVTVTGSLITPKDYLPVHGLPITIHLIKEGLLGTEKEVEICKDQEIVTNQDGKLQFVCKNSDLTDPNLKRVILKVHSAIKSKNLFNQCDPLIFDTITVISKEELGKISKETTSYDLKTHIVSVLEYDEEGDNYYQPKNPKHIPQPKNGTFIAHIIEDGWNQFFKSIGSTIFKETTKEVQESFGIPKERLQHTAEVLKEMVFTFYDPKTLLEGENDTLVLDLNFDRYDQDQKDEENKQLPPDLPNLKIVFNKEYDDEGGLLDLSIQEITLKYSEDEEAKTFQPDDEKSIRAACHVLAFTAEARTHLGECHLGSAVYAMAFLKHFIHSPLAALLAPFLEGILRINYKGETAIFNKKEGVLGIGKLSQKGIDEYLKDTTDSINNEENIPTPRFKNDLFGHQKKALYNTFLMGVKQFIKDNIKEIKKHKHEIYYMGLCLKTHGKNFDLIMEDRDNLDEMALEKLAKILAYFMYLIAHHYLTHDMQRRWVLDLAFASMAPHNNITDENVKDDLYSGTDPQSATKQLSIGHILVNLDESLYKKTLTTNPDMAKQIVEAFENEDNKKLFKELKLDPSKIASTVMY